MCYAYREFTLNLSRNSLKNQAFIEKALDLSFFEFLNMNIKEFLWQF